MRMTPDIWTNSYDTGRITPADQAENPFVKLVPDQTIAIIPSFELESGVVLQNVPLAYKTYGTLSPQADNVMVICHALTGSADVGDWWGPLLGGPGGDGRAAKAFDMSRFFVVCMNSLGSPYGTASPVTARDGIPGNEHYGPEFPLTTVRDDVRLFKLLLDDLGVKQIASVIGGSMGGMLVLEFAYFGIDYVRTIVPIATSARYSAWGISWGEAQRQSIYSDPKYDDGYYHFDDPPAAGLGAARMSALLMYRSRDSFETRFGRNVPESSEKQKSQENSSRPATPTHEHFAIHNDGHRNAGTPRSHSDTPPPTNGRTTPLASPTAHPTITDPQFHGATPLPGPPANSKARLPSYYSAQSYLRYQGQKFITRFDANCYIAITRKLDSHDVSRHRTSSTDEFTPDKAAAAPSDDELNAALARIEQPTLVLGIQSDGLFTYNEQQQLAAAIPHSELKTIDSPEGHDAFLLEFQKVNGMVREFLARELKDIMAREPVNWPPAQDEPREVKASTFGEAEVDDITAW
nr:homoserine o-acetyltransferase [Quercus suber]